MLKKVWMQDGKFCTSSIFQQLLLNMLLQAAHKITKILDINEKYQRASLIAYSCLLHT